MTVLLATKDFSRFSELVTKLWHERAVELAPTTSGIATLAHMKRNVHDLVIIDEQLDDMSGIALAKQVVKMNPLVNTAIVSSLPAQEFHEATEGLGVLMQLPANPRETDAEALLAILEKIGILMMQPAEPSRQEAVQS